MTLKQLGEWRLEAMRRDARCRDARCGLHAADALASDQPRRIAAAELVRRSIGSLLLRAGLTLLGDQ